MINWNDVHEAIAGFGARLAWTDQNVGASRERALASRNCADIRDPELSTALAGTVTQSPTVATPRCPAREVSPADCRRL